jgi:hypothetical protein
MPYYTDTSAGKAIALKSLTLGTSVVSVPLITTLIANVLNELYVEVPDVYEIVLVAVLSAPGANESSR